MKKTAVNLVFGVVFGKGEIKFTFNVDRHICVTQLD